MDHPIDNIQWIEAVKLDPNDYNPNVVYTPELKLLKLSLMKQGWIQPILVNRDEMNPIAKPTIIDGFHRWMLTKEDSEISAMTDGKVPCAVLNLSEPDRMMLTIRINRAKGSHIAIKMHEIIDKLVTHYGIAKEGVAKGIGATKAEVDLLLAENVFKKLDIPNHKYSKAWYPK
jgi:ParB-like chromosome segregation protein Spo0J